MVLNLGWNPVGNFIMDPDLQVTILKIYLRVSLFIIFIFKTIIRIDP